MPGATGYRPLPGSERPQIAGSKLLGPVEASERVRVTVLLRPKPGSPELPDLEHWQDTPPEKRTYVSPEEFYETHGAAQEEVDAVLDYLTSKGLRKVDAHAGRRRIVVEGTAAEMNSAFAVTLNRYRAPGLPIERPQREGKVRPFAEHTPGGEQVHRGFEGPVSLPAKLVGIVTAVIGLDNRRLGVPAGSGTGDPAGAQYLDPLTIARRYNFPTNSAAGQTIGIFESGGAAYLHSDITDFINSLPGPPAQPHLFDISLNSSNNPALVTSPPTGGVFECIIDVAIAAAAAPGVNINVYFTDGSETGWEDFFQRAIFPLAGDHAPSVLTASWVPFLSDDSTSIGLLSNPGSPVSIFHGYLRSAAHRGITVFMALGDWGSNNLNGGTKCHVSYPNCDPFVTSCGGTILGEANATPPPAFDEWTWSDANVASQFDLAPYDATGGGVSDTFDRPPYQIHSGVLPISKNDGNVRRGIPDVAGMVAMSGFFVKGGGGWEGVGTSAVSPLYAGLVATINAFLGRNVGFLNPTLYRHGRQICNDITVGNNDSGLLPDAPFYTADIGWDACTGWGSIDGMRLLAALAPAALLSVAVPDRGNFGDACLDGFVDEIFTLNNAGFATLLIWNITSSQPAFEVPSVTSFPLAISPGASMDIVIRYKPTAAAPQGGLITIFSNSLFSPQIIRVTGTGVAPHLTLAIADTGNFGDVCVGSFHDEPLVVNNSGHCTLQVNAITSNSPEFLPPEVLSYPITVAAGASVSLPLRFQPTHHGAAAGTITVASNDARGPQSLRVSGNAPAGKLAVCGSAYFGEVDCGIAQKTLSICNVGDCKLRIASVEFSRKRHNFRLINNPFPATLHPGSCLCVVIEYRASCEPECCELVIRSDDPADPVRVLDVVAFTRCEKKCTCEAKVSSCGCGCGESDR
ncbi:MAG: choice-of-anchor D domain-containing protein [Acidobacteriaceae bacterium]